MSALNCLSLCCRASTAPHCPTEQRRTTCAACTQRASHHGPCGHMPVCQIRSPKAATGAACSAPSALDASARNALRRSIAPPEGLCGDARGQAAVQDLKPVSAERHQWCKGVSEHALTYRSMLNIRI